MMPDILILNDDFIKKVSKFCPLNILEAVFKDFESKSLIKKTIIILYG